LDAFVVTKTRNEEHPVSDLQDDFQAKAESATQDAKELERIEREKEELDAGDPRAASLSNEAEQTAEQLHHKTSAERDLTKSAGAEG
jgi:hypothetical protein